MTIADLYSWGIKHNVLNLPIELLVTNCGKATIVSKSLSCEYPYKEMVVQLSNDETQEELDE